MTDEEYPEPLVVETASACPGLARLPRLPVRILVLTAPGLDDPERRGLAARLVRLSDELGVADGVAIVGQEMAGWQLVLGSTERQRYDIVLLRPSKVPAGTEEDDPRADVVDTLSRVLGDLQTRYWVLDPPPGDADSADDTRRMKLCRRLVDRGAPPVVLIPPGWEVPDLLQFHEDLLERTLYDAPLAKAVARATADLRPVPAIFQPAGGRHGLDLGRLLEAHRQRIDDVSSDLRSFGRELEAARPSIDETLGSQQIAWNGLDDAAHGRLDSLEQVRDALAEINRDRDPAGWSRLAQNIDELRDIEEAVRRDRDQLQALRLVAQSLDSIG